MSLTDIRLDLELLLIYENTAKLKPSYKFDNRRKHRFSRIVEFPPFCNVAGNGIQYAMFADEANSAVNEAGGISTAEVKPLDNGYLVVTADYDTTGELEEYIDLIPMLNNLFIEPENFLPHIKEVKLKNA